MKNNEDKILKVGQTVEFDTWQEKDKDGVALDRPKRVSNTGTISALSNVRPENEKLGTVTVTLKDKSTVDLHPLEVRVKE